MSDITLRPRSATEIVDASFQVYRREPLQFILGLGLIHVPWLVILAALGADPTDRRQGLSLGASMGVALGGILVSVLASGVTICIANDVYFGRAADVAEAFRRVGTRLVSLLVVTLAVAVLTGLGFVLLVVPGIYVLLRFFAVTATILLEDVDAGGAMRRSSQLSQDRKWHVLGTFLLVFLLAIAVSFGVNMVAEMIPLRIIRLVLSIAATVVTYPMFGISTTLLYYDCRIRNEGFDVEYLASTVPAPVPEQAGS